jgi:hypothetical protein
MEFLPVYQGRAGNHYRDAESTERRREKTITTKAQSIQSKTSSFVPLRVLGVFVVSLPVFLCALCVSVVNLRLFP